MGAQKGGDEDLVFQAEARQLGQYKGAFNSDTLLRNADALDNYWEPWAIRSKSCQSEACFARMPLRNLISSTTRKTIVKFINYCKIKINLLAIISLTDYAFCSIL